MQTLITEFVVTEKCNLNCEYCYMKNESTFMSMDAVHKFIENVPKMMKIYRCKDYHISYFGGEPLLNWDVVKEAIQLFNNEELCESQVIITNGLLLTQEIIDFAKANNVGFSWSFDGMWQDENRPHSTIEDTISVYKDKLPLINQIGLGCKVMVAPQNISTMTENLKFLVDEFGMNSPDFSLVRDDIWSDEDVEKFRIESRRLAEAVISYFEAGQYVSAGFFNLALMDLLVGNKYGKRPFGCFAGCCGVGYFPNGDFYPCARFGASKELILMNSGGELFHENINSLNTPKITNPAEMTKCQTCSLFNFCNAGCTYSQLHIKNGIMVAEPVDSVCELFHIIYNDTFYINDTLKDNKVYQQHIENIRQQIGV